MKKEKYIGFRLESLCQELNSIRLERKSLKIDSILIQRDDCLYQDIKKNLREIIQHLKNYLQKPNCLTPEVYHGKLKDARFRLQILQSYITSERSTYHTNVAKIKDLRQRQKEVVKDIFLQKEQNKIEEDLLDTSFLFPDVVSEDLDFGISDLFDEICINSPEVLPVQELLEVLEPLSKVL
jgi:hypothetical protein